MSFCKYVGKCEDIGKIRRDEEIKVFGKDFSGIRASHEILCDSSLHPFCSLYKTYVIQDLIGNLPGGEV